MFGCGGNPKRREELGLSETKTVMLLRDGGRGPAIGGGKNREEPDSSRHSGERGVQDDLHRSRSGLFGDERRTTPLCSAD
ncbi:hypothetical protein QJS04_geneDACA023790 [Acorus gramineus]|uniref:Uncharacterized protein n=1 Tax=Acorus gramineus TaxID=55184 RepID=A0AAV9AA01_ACOGR|nr:hypothetical protein QJS04_geneDACA023790 [Acorus gramineus]